MEFPLKAFLLNMNILLENYLIAKHPKIIIINKHSLSDGLTCGDGWFFIIDTLCESIQHHIDNPPYLPKKGIKKFLNQIKQMWNLTTWNKIIHPLLKKLPFKYYEKYSKYLQFYITSHEAAPENYIPQVVLIQVKEKFGGLRIYYRGGDTHIHATVQLAEQLSYKTCEVCGKIDSTVGVNTIGWRKTTCKEHTRNQNEFKFNIELDSIFKIYEG